MRSIRSVFVATLGFTLLASGTAQALDICDELGLSGLTISTDNNCLQITGGVRYEYVWGEEPDSRDAPDDDGGTLDVCDALGLSGLTISTDNNCLSIEDVAAFRYLYDPRPAVTVTPSFIFTAPVNLNFLATEQPLGTLMNPALTIPVSSSGIGADLSFSTGLGGGASLKASINFGSLSGSGEVRNVAFPNGIGITSVGITPGVYYSSAGVPFPTDIDSARTDLERSWVEAEAIYRMSLLQPELGADMPLAIFAGVGPIFGRGTQIMHTEINATTPAFGVNGGSFIQYDTVIENTGIGAEGTIEIAGILPFDGPDVFFPAEDTSISRFAPIFFYRADLGINVQSLFSQVTDSVDALGLGGGVNHVSSNSFDVQNWFVGGSLGGTIGVQLKNVELSLGGRVNVVPLLDVYRPDSDAGGAPLAPVVTADPIAEAYLEIGARVSF
jgi:hypothetical protein